ncbi:MAG: helix-turn-helix domain-containing protein [Actinomycetia bacterium]|nr:helix-turn-helix domain-containing protein [Actinomycetes bacterium]
MASPTSGGSGLLSSPVRRTIVDYIADIEARGHQGLTAGQLAEILNVHVTTARFHLDQLVTGGLLEAAFVKQGVGRPRKVYTLAPGSPCAHDDDHAIRILAELLTDSLGALSAGERLTPFDAGLRWAREHVPAEPADAAMTPGRWLAKIGRLIDVLREWGYTTNLTGFDSARTAELELVHCPFLDLAKSNPEVVCGVHRGLVTGTLQQLGEDEVEVTLEPFSRAHRCLVHVQRHHPFTRNRRSSETVSDPAPISPSHDDTPSKETA